MEEPARCRDLRAQFESLDPGVRLWTYFEDDVPIGDIRADVPCRDDRTRRDSTKQRFRTFAERGAKFANSVPEDLLSAWLILVRNKAPHYFKEFEISHSAHPSFDVPFSSLIPPTEDHPGNREVAAKILADVASRAADALAPREGPSTLVVEPRDNRYLIIDGHHWYDSFASRGLAIVKCCTGEPRTWVTSGGILDRLREASIEVCEQLETESFVAIHRAESNGESPLIGGPRLAAWLKAQQGTGTLHSLHVATRVDRKTLSKILKADKISFVVLRRLSTELKIPLSEIPTN